MRTLVRILSHLPLKVLYALMQGILYPMAFYIVRYRRKVVQRNLKNSFPEKTEKERKELEKKFYHWFCDLIAEIIYGYRISNEEIDERVEIIDQEALEPVFKQAGGGIVMLAHLGCWEWIADAARRWSPGFHMDFIYRTLKSPGADRLMIELREKRGGGVIEMHQLLRRMIRERGDTICHIYAMLSDQKPGKNDLDCRAEFLNQDTPFISGTEKLARRFNLPVYYIEIHHKGRGKYIVSERCISVDSANTEPGYITQQYAKLLEENIKSDPHIWLWTHNRFKYSKPIERKD